MKAKLEEKKQHEEDIFNLGYDEKDLDLNVEKIDQFKPKDKTNWR